MRGCGQYEHVRAKRESALVNAPAAARARILGERPVFLPIKEHRIVVDIKTETRTVETVDLVAPLPVYLPFKPKVPAEPKPAKELTPAQRATVKHIIAVCARHWDVNQGAITSESRAACFVRPRHACFRLARDILGLSLPIIGRVIAGRDHTTVIAAIKRTDLLIETDADWRTRYEAAHAELTRSAAP